MNQRIFAELIPNSEFHLIPEGSHCSQMEKPEYVNGLIEEFFQSLAQGKKNKSKKKRSVNIREKNLS